MACTPPPPGSRWVRYGPDLLLVNLTTGRVEDTAYGVFL
ncbi:MAG: RcnB family protein [Caulobacteraceae bacterium]